MALWKKEDGDSAGERPNWLSADEKARCYCDDRGWVLVHLDGTEEVLVAGSSLNKSTDDAAADAVEKATAIAAKDAQMLDQDGDGVRAYQDADDLDSTNS
tara:strand:+ start:5255 stop:5554 length:300 start_codon:yes stop_codon:yes gene_type:complete